MNKSNQNHSSKTLPIKQLTFQDILDVFFIGLSDFLTAPAFGLFFGSIFAMGGLTITVLVFQFGACRTIISTKTLANPIQIHLNFYLKLPKTTENDKRIRKVISLTSRDLRIAWT